MRDEPPAQATTVQLAFFLPERSNSPPYFENDQWVDLAWQQKLLLSLNQITQHHSLSLHLHSYVARIDENSLQGTALIFTDPYVSRVYDDDTGKNGVFSLTLLSNNGTFEISPNVAERRANFLIYVRDNHLLDFEMRHSVQFQVSASENFATMKSINTHSVRLSFRYLLRNLVQPPICRHWWMSQYTLTMSTIIRQCSNKKYIILKFRRISPLDNASYRFVLRAQFESKRFRTHTMFRSIPLSSECFDRVNRQA